MSFVDEESWSQERSLLKYLLAFLLFYGDLKACLMYFSSKV
jgi:hypothetical protein